ncbi:murein hydrolase activator EnvC family protein [Ancylobacter dichloromethanicus]
MSLGTRIEAQVASPSDGWVVYAGPFRSYGQLLIINAGGGYHILLAGMDKITVELGQFVLSGEPVGGDGARSPSSCRRPALEPPNPFSTSSSARMETRSIQRHGGRRAKARRYADDA